jgi:hypothetical protein
VSREQDLQRALAEEKAGTISPKKKAALDKLRSLGKVPGPDAPKQDRAFGQRPVDQYLWDQAKIGFTGISGAAGDAVDAVHSLVGPSEQVRKAIGAPEPISVGKIIRQGWGGLLGVENIKAPSKHAELGGKVAQVVGTSPLALYTAATATRPLLGAYTEGSSLLGQAVGKVSGAAVGQELGELGEKYGFDGAKLANTTEDVGEVAGAFGPIGLHYAGQRAFSAGKSWWSGRQAAGQSAAARALKESLDYPDAMANLSRAKEVQDNLGLKFDLAQATGAPGVRLLAGQVAGESPGLLNRETARYNDNVALLQAEQQARFGDSPELGLQPAKQFGQDVDTAIKRGESVVEREYQNLTNTIQPSVPSQEVGSKLRASRDAAYETLVKRFDDEYGALSKDADAAGVKVDMTDIVDYVKRTFGTDAATYQRPDMPPVFRQIYQRHIKPDAEESAKGLVEVDSLAMNPQAIEQFITQENARKEGSLKRKYVSFNEFHSLMKEATKDARQARNRTDFSPGYLSDLNDVIRRELGELESAAPEGVATKLKDINSRYRTGLVDVYRKGVGGKLGETTRLGERVADEDITREFFKPNTQRGSADAMDDFNNLYKGDARARDMLEQGVLNVLVGPQGVLKDGVVDAAKLGAFRTRYSNALSKNPALDKRLKTVASVADMVAERNRIVTAQKKEFEESAFAQIIGKQTPEEAIDLAMKNPKEMGKLVNLAAQNPNASKGMASALGQYVFKQSDPAQFLKDHEFELKAFFNRLGPGHWKNAVDIADAYTILNRSKPPGKANVGQEWDWLKDKVNVSSASVFARARAVRQGRSSAVQEAVSTAAEAMGGKRKQAYIKALEEAIYNPDLALAMVNVSRSKNPSPVQMNSVKRHLLSAGFRVVATEEEIPN